MKSTKKTTPRPKTAKEIAAAVGCTARTVQRWWAQPRADYLANSLMRSKPWEALGMSRATWYRRGKPIAVDSVETGVAVENGI